MATYAIGDVHACYDQLQQLLDKIKFDPVQDTLWFTGDLINGGPNPVETLRFVKSLGEKHITVLGNHDLFFLGIAGGEIDNTFDRGVGFQPILTAPDFVELTDWIRMQRLVHYDANFDTLLVHAGVLPTWDLPQILSYAEEVTTRLRHSTWLEFFRNIEGNNPDTWDENLQDWARIRFLVNCFTRMRFCTADGKLDLKAKGSIEQAPAGYYPWFQVPNRKTINTTILFGHWAALRGIRDVTNQDNVIGLDTGCMWHGSLTAMRLDDKQFFSVENPI